MGIFTQAFLNTWWLQYTRHSHDQINTQTNAQYQVIEDMLTHSIIVTINQHTHYCLYQKLVCQLRTKNSAASSLPRIIPSWLTKHAPTWWYGWHIINSWFDHDVRKEIKNYIICHIKTYIFHEYTKDVKTFHLPTLPFMTNQAESDIF